MTTRKTRRRTSRRLSILLAEDDEFYAERTAAELRDEGFDVEVALTGADVVRLIKDREGEFTVAILDILMPPGSELKAAVARARSRTGLYVARWLKNSYPRIRLIAMSNDSDAEVVDWFTKHGSGFVPKSAGRDSLLRYVRRAVRRGDFKTKPRCFLIHGHDSDALAELRDYLSNGLGIRELVVLREQPNLGRTLIEKFEQEVQKVDVVFVLLTPDDHGAAAAEPNDVKRRARQNVVFELGYFFGRLQRSSGSIILLHKGGLELPSDIDGIVSIDITAGIREKDTEIRRELVGWL